MDNTNVNVNAATTDANANTATVAVEVVKLDKSVYSAMVKTSSEMLDSILLQLKTDCNSQWNYANSRELDKLSEDLANIGKPLKLCQSLKGLAMLTTAPWAIVKPESIGATAYKFSKLGYAVWNS